MKFVTACTQAVAIATIALSTSARGELISDFYRGKTVQFIVGYSPGGGFDAYTRAAARFIGKHIPGSPNVVVQNMPGASSLKAVRYMAARAPRDGTEIAMFNRALIANSMMDPAIKVDFNRFTWIGSMTRDISVCYLWKSKGIDSLKALAASQATIGGTSKNSGGYANAATLRHLTGGAVRSILGYTSAGDIWIAMEKGEVDGNCGSWSGLKAQRGQWLAEKKVDLLVQFSSEPHPDLKAVPLIFELAKTDREKQALRFLIASNDIAYPVIAPPDLSADRTKALRAAFEVTMADPEFRSFAEKVKMEIDVVTGDRAAAIVQEILDTPEDAVGLAKKMTE